MRNISVIGHRGAAGLAPENTLSGFCLAWQLGVDAVELDVHLTADGEIIVHHEYCLNPETTRTHPCRWLNCSTPPPIKDLTLDKLKVYDVGRLKPGTTYAHLYPMQKPVDCECIPTLHEVIATSKTIRNGNSQFWIEIKTSPEKPVLVDSLKGNSGFNGPMLFFCQIYRNQIQVTGAKAAYQCFNFDPLFRWQLRFGDIHQFDGGQRSLIVHFSVDQLQGLECDPLGHRY